MDRVSTFGKRLKEYREDSNLTLSDIERATGVPAQTVNRYELGQRVPKIDMATDIADSLGINPLWLLGYNVSMDPDSNRPVPFIGDGSEDQELINIWKGLSSDEIQRAKDFATGLIAARKTLSSQSESSG